MFEEHGFAGEAAGSTTERVQALTGAVDALLAVRVDELDEGGLRAELAGLERELRRLQARSGELARAVTARQARRARQANPDDARAGERGARQARDELAGQLQWSPSQAKGTIDTAQHLEGLPQAQAAYRDGQLGPEHARVLTRTLHQLAPAQREQAEPRLLEAARTEDPVTFGRTARRVLAELDQDAAMRDLDRKHAQRSGRLAQDPDGMTRLNLSVTGIDAEIVATAIHTYRRPDAPGEHRAPEQATADAVIEALRGALRFDQTTTAHGTRPQVVVHISWRELCQAAGVAETTYSGAIPAREVRRLLDDAAISRVVTGPDSLPLDTGRATRNVGVGIWKALLARDGGCTYPGCDAPPAWCDGAHRDQRWAPDLAGVSADELALLCRRHHRYIDRQHATGRLEHGRIVWYRPDGTPIATTTGYPRPATGTDRAPPRGTERPAPGATDPP